MEKEVMVVLHVAESFRKGQEAGDLAGAAAGVGPGGGDREGHGHFPEGGSKGEQRDGV